MLRDTALEKLLPTFNPGVPHRAQTGRGSMLPLEGLKPPNTRLAPLDIGAKALRQIIQFEMIGHEGNLIQTHFEKPQNEFSRELVAIDCLDHQGPPAGVYRHRPSCVFIRCDCRPPRQTAGDRPQSVGANVCHQCHRMAHKTADEPISMRQRMNVVQAMVGGLNCHDPRCVTLVREAKASLDLRPEVIDPVVRRRNMQSDGDIMLGALSPFVQFHDELGIGAAYPPHHFGRVSMELPVKPSDKFRRRRLW